MQIEEFEFTRAEELFPPTLTWEISAQLQGTDVSELLTRASRGSVTLNVIDLKGKGGKPDVRRDVTTIPGHIWGGYPGEPRHADVMIIGKRPGDDEMATGRNLQGNSGIELARVCRKCGLPYQSFWVTNIVQFLPPDGGKNLKAHHRQDCATLLAQELQAVRPKYILLLGSDAVKFLFGRKATMTSLRGAVLNFKYDEVGVLPTRDYGNDLDVITTEFSKAQVMVTTHTAAILREPSLVPGFEKDIELFADLIHGRRGTQPPIDQVNNYQYIRDAETLNALVDRLIAESYTNISIDCEWGGTKFTDGYLRTIQFSWAAGQAAVVVLRDCEHGRTPVFKPAIINAIEAIRRLIDRPGVKLWGQSMRSDALWLEDFGLPVMKRFAFDTMLADHVINESWEHGLSALTVRYTNMGRYDFELQSWLKLHPQPKDAGYANIPDAILHPYSAADADAVFRITPVLVDILGRSENADIAWLFYQIVMPASHPIHEMERTGMLVDPERMVDLLWKYDAKKKEILKELRAKINWPEFNPRSWPQKQKLLFGPKQDGMLGMTPIKTTEKPSREWSEVMKLPTEERERLNAATDGETLNLLWIDAPDDFTKAVILKLEHFQTIDQITKNFLRLPKGYTETDELNVAFDRDIYVSGLLGHIDDDGRIRTTISQLKETGRYSSSRPNLQNISKRQEPRYREIMGEDIPTIRSCFVHSPGHVLVEADYKSAEIVTLAYLSNDPQLIADALGPVKLHAKVAVDLLGAPCSYEEVAKKFEHLYVGAKNINFGIPYQRGARAIARQVNRETKGKANMTGDEAQGIINNWYARYARVRSLVDRCKRGVQRKPHWIPNPWGRRRRFYVSPSQSVMAAQEREAVNFPIQSTVAEALSKALFNLYQYRRLHPAYNFKILLAIHDAILFDVPVEILDEFIDSVLPLCMVHGVEIPSCAFYGSPAFKLDIDSDITLRWGEQPQREHLEVRGVPERFLPKAG